MLRKPAAPHRATDGITQVQEDHQAELEIRERGTKNLPLFCCRRATAIWDSARRTRQPIKTACDLKSTRAASPNTVACAALMLIKHSPLTNKSTVMHLFKGVILLSMLPSCSSNNTDYVTSVYGVARTIPWEKKIWGRVDSHPPSPRCFDSRQRPKTSFF